MLGTAIGYLKHGGTGQRTTHKLRITHLSTPTSTVRVTKGTTSVSLCGQILAGAGDPFRWAFKQGSVQTHVTRSTRLDDTTFDLELGSVAGFTTGNVDLLEPDEPEDRFLLKIKTVTSATKIRVEAGYDKVNVCSRISRAPKVIWNIFQGNSGKLPIAACTRISDSEYELDLDAPRWAAVECWLQRLNLFRKWRLCRPVRTGPRPDRRCA